MGRKERRKRIKRGENGRTQKKRKTERMINWRKENYIKGRV